MLSGQLQSPCHRGTVPASATNSHIKRLHRGDDSLDLGFRGPVRGPQDDAWLPAWCVDKKQRQGSTMGRTCAGREAWW